MISQQWVMCPVCDNKTRIKGYGTDKLSSILSEVQKRKFNQCKESESVHCERARR